MKNDRKLLNSDSADGAASVKFPTLENNWES